MNHTSYIILRAAAWSYCPCCWRQALMSILLTWFRHSQTLFARAPSISISVNRPSNQWFSIIPNFQIPNQRSMEAHSRFSTTCIVVRLRTRRQFPLIILAAVGSWRRPSSRRVLQTLSPWTWSMLLIEASSWGQPTDANICAYNLFKPNMSSWDKDVTEIVLKKVSDDSLPVKSLVNVESASQDDSNALTCWLATLRDHRRCGAHSPISHASREWPRWPVQCLCRMKRRERWWKVEGRKISLKLRNKLKYKSCDLFGTARIWLSIAFPQVTRCAVFYY